MLKKETKKPAQKQSRYEANRCQYEVNGGKCRMLYTISSAPGAKKYCSWHYFFVLPRSESFTKQDFVEWLAHHLNLSGTDQFANYKPESLWIMVRGEQGRSETYPAQGDVDSISADMSL